MKKIWFQKRKQFALTLFAVALIGLLAPIAYSGNSPAALAQPVPGKYELFFFTSGPSGLEPVSSLPVCTSTVCEELILNAHITEESSGLPAQSGLVVFQYCSYKGLPPNDITRADEAPLEACEIDGTAKWANLATFKVNQSGDAFLDFGVVLIPRTIGFRFQYKGQGGIANGVSDPKNFIWTP
jgi:hypothetical protein